MIGQTRRLTFASRRICFVISQCEHCAVIKSFLDRFNLNLPLERQIRILDCTRYHDLGIIDHPLIREYKDYIRGTYPLIFIGFQKLEGATTEQEVHTFLIERLKADLILERHNPYAFDKTDCRWVKNTFGVRRLICQ